MARVETCRDSSSPSCFTEKDVWQVPTGSQRNLCKPKIGEEKYFC